MEDVPADGGTRFVTVAAGPDWAEHELTARVPADRRIVGFGVFLAGRGRIELADPELARGT
ncbi:MAG TPA: hypothetical protein VHF26_24115 [Trebonia sp.]|nr:hypothetical protein [Trebonia sp.]